MKIFKKALSLIVALAITASFAAQPIFVEWKKILYQFTGKCICAGHEWFLLSGKCVWAHWIQELLES